jgi:transposase InsO family protein
MREQGLYGRLPRRFRRTTDSNHDQAVAPNVLGRRFQVNRPNEVWVSDITYVRTWEGWLFLAVILDLFSRRVVGWATESHMQSSLVLQALRMALGRRQPAPGLLFHSDRGSQYASQLHQQLLKEHGLVCSMSRRGDCWDNAVAESFIGTLKVELIYRSPWPSRRSAKEAVGEFIECFYNPKRLHSSLGYVSPNEFERCLS